MDPIGHSWSYLPLSHYPQEFTVAPKSRNIMNKEKVYPISNYWAQKEGPSSERNLGKIWAIQANKTQLKVEQDPNDGILYQELGSHDCWSVLTNVT